MDVCLTLAGRPLSHAPALGALPSRRLASVSRPPEQTEVCAPSEDAAWVRSWRLGRLNVLSCSDAHTLLAANDSRRTTAGGTPALPGSKSDITDQPPPSHPLGAPNLFGRCSTKDVRCRHGCRRTQWIVAGVEGYPKNFHRASQEQEAHLSPAHPRPETSGVDAYSISSHTEQKPTGQGLRGSSPPQLQRSCHASGAKSQGCRAR